MSLSTNSRNVGAVVKKYNQDDYHTLMAKAVARTPLPVEKAEVLSFLHDMGYLGKRSYKKLMNYYWILKNKGGDIMYSYTFDCETGGLLLNSTPTVFSKEPRPVYAAELDMLGFDKYWNYDKQNDVPYMWAESVNYYYYGKLVAKLKGGDLLHAPEIILATDENGEIVKPVPDGEYLKPINLIRMIAKTKR